ncbi:MAG: flavodoxin [Candidatus Pacebacteria bacterium]|jgi:flavodoxin I|nr:flavodoxin [Candidatus Paceibacterota bacterium]MBT4652296.1 flavodoxin [Candidatus Paceibacterota bacterium]MBT6756489.1 flavodoxin [Candidatus Paceibacterota bacterium]MBT6921462.1 flavodoxin [Candidatus Paceibacterota bacterium]
MKTLILYGSLTGNTQYVAEQISEFLTQSGIEHEIMNANSFSVKDVLNYDLLLLGSSTWDDGILQYDFDAFFQEVQDFDFTDKKIAVFGCGDSSYEHFCGAVDTIEKFWQEKGAIKLINSLKIDGFPQQEPNLELLQKWLADLQTNLK